MCICVFKISNWRVFVWCIMGFSEISLLPLSITLSTLLKYEITKMDSHAAYPFGELVFIIRIHKQCSKSPLVRRPKANKTGAGLTIFYNPSVLLADKEYRQSHIFGELPFCIILKYQNVLISNSFSWQPGSKNHWQQHLRMCDLNRLVPKTFREVVAKKYYVSGDQIAFVSRVLTTTDACRQVKPIVWD